MSLATQLQNLATRVATEVKAVRTLVNGNAADLSVLTTSAKTNLVAAINEVRTQALTSEINDGTTTISATWSSSRITTAIAALKTDILGGADAAYDTLKELQDKVLGEDSAINGILTALGNRVRVDAAQSFTTPQQAQARSNIDAASATGVGDTSTNYVTTFESGLA